VETGENHAALAQRSDRPTDITNFASNYNAEGLKEKEGEAATGDPGGEEFKASKRQCSY